MVQKTYYKTKDYCKVKFTFSAENAETVEILGLNSDWENSIIMSKKKDGWMGTRRRIFCYLVAIIVTNTSIFE
jgi:hypothetical protein